MAGKKGRSGRRTRGAERSCREAIQQVAERSHYRVAQYVNYLCKVKDEDLTPQQAQHLITLHLKHSPDPPKTEENQALDILKQMAIEGAKEYARLKHTRVGRVHYDIMQEAEQADIVQHTPIQDNATQRNVDTHLEPDPTPNDDIPINEDYTP